MYLVSFPQALIQNSLAVPIAVKRTWPDSEVNDSLTRLSQTFLVLMINNPRPPLKNVLM